MSDTTLRIDRLTWVRFQRAVRTLMTSAVGGRARLMAAALFAGLLAINALNVINSYVGRDFMTSIEAREWSGFVRYGVLYLVVFAVSTAVAVLQRFAEERLGLLWRKWLTNLMVHSYLADHVYFRLGADAGVSNPDQRIAEDIRSFSTTTLSFVLMLSNGALTALAFSGVLWSISPTLFGVSIAYAALGSLFTIWLARPLVRLSSQQSDREADFRSDLIHVRENADLVALLHREERLTTRLVRHLDALVENAKRMIALNRRVGFFSTGSMLTGTETPSMVCTSQRVPARSSDPSWTGWLPRRAMQPEAANVDPRSKATPRRRFIDLSSWTPAVSSTACSSGRRPSGGSRDRRS